MSNRNSFDVQDQVQELRNMLTIKPPMKNKVLSPKEAEESTLRPAVKRTAIKSYNSVENLHTKTVSFSPRIEDVSPAQEDSPTLIPIASLPPPSQISSPSIPNDDFAVAYFIFLFLGIGILVPGSSFLLSIDYFRFLFRNIPALEYIFSFGFNTGQLIGLIFLITVLERFSIASHRITTRILLFYLLQFISLMTAGTIAFVAWHYFNAPNLILFKQYLSEHTLLYYSLFTILLCSILTTGIASGVLVGTLFGYAATYPWEYTQSIMSGLGCASALFSIPKIISRIVLQNWNQWEPFGTFGFFTLAALFQILSMIFVELLYRLPISKYCSRMALLTDQLELKRAQRRAVLMKKSKSTEVYTDSSVREIEEVEEEEEEEEESSVDHETEIKELITYVQHLSSSSGEESGLQKKKSIYKSAQRLLHSFYDDPTITTMLKRKFITPTWSQVFAQYWFVTKQTPVAGFAVFVTFVCTYFLNPGLLGDMMPEYPESTNVLYFTITLLSIYAWADCIGRLLPRWKRTVILDFKLLWLAIVARFLFIPLFFLLMWNQIPLLQNTVLADYAVADVWKYLTVFLLGISHGYCCTVGMMRGPTLVAPHLQYKSGLVMTFYLNAGLFVGSTLSLGLGFIVEKYLLQQI